MELNKRNRELLFWLLQFLGWGAISATIFIFASSFSLFYLIYSFVGSTLMGIAASSCLRWYLKRKVDLKNFEINQILKVLFAGIVTGSVYFGLYLLLEHNYELHWTRTEKELEFIEALSNEWIGLLSSIFYMFGWLFIYYLIKFLMRSNADRIERMELNNTLREAQLNTLKGQVNPHFMFNSLNNIRGLMLEDVQKSREMLGKLSEMLQYALIKNTVDAIPLGEELEMVDNYIALSKIQMEERLQFKKTIAPETRNIPIPPMIIQLLVENAAKHGISNLREGGLISLTTDLEEGTLSIVVSNTGKLRLSQNSTQLGLKNIRQRLKLLYGGNSTFSLEEVEDEVVATIKIPTL